MATIEDRWYRVVDGEKQATARHGTGKRWQLRYRDLDGTARKVSYRRKVDAEAQKAEIEADAYRGGHVDPKAGRISFDDFAADWIAHRTSDPLTIQDTKARLRRYVTGTPLGKTPLGKIRPSTVQAWIKSLTIGGSTARVVFDHVSSILAAAVDDGAIGQNPCTSKSVTPPKRVRGQIVPWTHERVAALRAAIQEHYMPLVDLAAWLGLRAGEVYGLSPEDIYWLRGWVHVQRQVKLVGHRRVFANPKGGKDRFVPLSEPVKDELAAYLARHPANTVTLPWGASDGAPMTVRLLVTNPKGEAIHSRSVTAGVWYPALDKAGIPRDRSNGMHALRHYYASVLLDDGESAKGLSEFLGHRDPGFTLRTYTHLMPTSEVRTRTAITKAFDRVAEFGDQSEKESDQ